MSDLRAKLLGAKKQFRSETYRYEDDGDVIEVQLRQPSIAERDAILQAAGITARDSKATALGKMAVQGLLSCAYDPKTGKKLFEPGDRDALLAMPTGSHVDEMGGIVTRLMNVKKDEPSGERALEAVRAYLAAADDPEAQDAAVALMQQAIAPGKA